MKPVLDQIGAWATEAPATFSATAREAAIHAITDTVGCIIAGRNEEPVADVRKGLDWAVDAVSAEKGAPLAGGGHAAASPAALINGTAAHALDFDDNFTPGMSHASAVLVPAILAVGAERKVSGKDLVNAYLVGLEAQAWVGYGVLHSHYTAGWHATSTVGGIGSAAGCAWLMGHDAKGIARALSLGVSTACGVKGQFGTLAKPFHAGVASRNAVEAAQFSAFGLTGRYDILEAPQGFQELFGGATPRGYEGYDPRVQGHVIETTGLLPKLHPCCGSTHLSVDMVHDLRTREGFSAADVESIALRVGIANWRNLAYPDPQNEMEARFSMQYCVARALCQDVLSLADFTPAVVKDAEIQALLPKISMDHFSAEEEAAEPRKAHEIVVTLKDGRVLKSSRKYPRGSIHDPLTEAARRGKFVDCCKGFATADIWYDQLQALDSWDDLSAIAGMFAAKA